MFLKRFGSFVLGLAVVVALAAGVSAKPLIKADKDEDKKRAEVITPINLAILIQDDLVSQVGNELKLTKEFIRALPQGSNVMVGYITTGTLQVRQPFTTDLDKAASSLRILRSTPGAAAYNPYVEVIEALRKFDNMSGRKVVLLISDGLDTAHGFDVSSAANSIDLLRAIREANKRDVAVYSFYAPSTGFTSRSRLAASYGQSSLNRLADETGGKAFFQGSTGFVSFDSYFRRFREALNDQYARAY